MRFCFATPRHLPPLLLWLVLLGFPAAAQEPAATLTLEEAIDLARRHNPTYRAQRNDEGAADWRVREAFGQLLPGAFISSGMQYQASGNPPRFGSFTGSELGLSRTPSYLLSDYFAGLSLQVDGATLLEPARALASRRAVKADNEAADFALVESVTRQYIAVLRSQDGVTLARQELERARENLELAEARVRVGTAIPLDATQARVERGRAEVALLQSEGGFRAEQFRLMEQLGVELDRELRLTSEPAVFDPDWTREELTSLALSRHPRLRALQATSAASTTQARAAWTAYLPTFNLSAGWSGFSRETGSVEYLFDQARDRASAQRESCASFNDILSRLANPLPPEDCSKFVVTAEDERRMAASNDVFPFEFTDQPFQASLRITLPVFSGFTRERQLEEARAAAADARHQLRAEELRLKTQVATAHQALETAHGSYAIELQNRELAEEQLQLARERYRLGLASFVELTEAETIKARAERSYLDALYGFQEALAALESAVGVNLRTGEKP